MFALPTSTFASELSPSAIAAPSANNSFFIQSYTPTQGGHGILFTVNLTCDKSMPLHVYEKMDLRLIAEDKNVCTKAIKGSDGQVTLRALMGNAVASLSGRVPLSLQLYSHGVLFDHCEFGSFTFTNEPSGRE